MRRRNRKKIVISPKVILIASIILCLALIFVSYKYSEFFSPIKTAIGNVISPMQKGITVAGTKVKQKLSIFSNMEELIDENAKLKEELELIKNENQQLIQNKYELNWFRDLYELDQKYTEYNKVGAIVISKETNSYYNIFTLDKGRDDGIEVDMNVIAGNGLVGIVTEVGANWCKVRSIIDDSSNVSGMFLKTSDNCIVSGDLELLDSGYIRVEMINIDAEIYNNYEVVTSYISDKFLPGILIGYVSNIEVDSSNMTKHAYLTPVVDFEHLEAVLIITELREQLED